LPDVLRGIPSNVDPPEEQDLFDPNRVSKTAVPAKKIQHSKEPRQFQTEPACSILVELESLRQPSEVRLAEPSLLRPA